ncbi:5-(carboxyamino)imidazole ribonucleotide synthase [Marinobacterium mangrovicola]|uniref:N5-carboxyaminoimidazole ribonucleotide synthase n=1 Tax=Marinobacterium mangrovicola TaxID=1476959 RepID=A0A4R1GMN7_9GAMM|nr:5-(carboxyamino)imidazole ribonucleotide synthase [Marinobacterium mangrovicola]TCK08423.1 5-(carboxyamino)imidazole ribonucleotide synthase [Marinobacterium mangrovicola]
MLPRIVVAGNGQLGQMLQQAGAPMQLKVMPVEPNQDIEVALHADDVITVEVEHWPDTVTGLQLKNHPNFRNASALHAVIDRQRQKSLLDQLQVPTAPWVDLDSEASLTEKLESLGERAVVKRRRGGYDGRGQWRWQRGGEVEAEWAETCIAEAMIPFSHEVSLVGARNAKGEKVFYPLTRNWHENGILRASVAGLDVPQEQQDSAEEWLSRIMDDQNYIGVMAMECFVVDGQLLVNELAPRVHNSGHWTQEGATISQFELHLRALAELPLIKPEIKGVSVMYNLLGRTWKTEWLGIDGVHVHWYGKSLRPGRKVGHVNINRPTLAQLEESLKALKELVDDEDRIAFDWSLEQL